MVRRAPRDIVDEVLVVDDGSKDALGRGGARRRRHGAAAGRDRRRGRGAARRVRLGARSGAFDVIVVMRRQQQGRARGDPAPARSDRRGGADFVQGSRFLAGGRTGGMPLYRQVATRLHPLLFSLTARKRVSESTNGFRAFRATLLDDPRIRLDQSWLDEYELEPYLYWKTIRLGYRTAEVPGHQDLPAQGDRLHEDEADHRLVVDAAAARAAGAGAAELDAARASGPLPRAGRRRERARRRGDARLGLRARHDGRARRRALQPGRGGVRRERRGRSATTSRSRTASRSTTA